MYLPILHFSRVGLRCNKKSRDMALKLCRLDEVRHEIASTGQTMFKISQFCFIVFYTPPWYRISQKSTHNSNRFSMSTAYLFWKIGALQLMIGLSVRYYGLQ